MISKILLIYKHIMTVHCEDKWGWLKYKPDFPKRSKTVTRKD